MIIEAIVSLTQKKSKVIMDDGFAFALYNREIKKFNLSPQKNISEEFYYTKIFPVLKNRAKERIAYILMSYDKTEYELRRKLKSSYYPDEVIDEVIEFAKNRRYIDDTRYAMRLIELYSDRKNKRYIEDKLIRKGILRDTVRELLSDIEIDEEALIRKEIKKKRYDLENMSRDDRKKIFSYLIRKGYSYDKVSAVLQNIDEF